MPVLTSSRIRGLGRQPWLIYGLLRTANGVSPHVSGGNALFTLIGFMGMYMLLGILFLFIMEREIARGPEFDRLFLIGMIKHHQGAIDMVDVLFKAYGAAQDETVFKFASDVYADQGIEIERMNKMLEDGGRPK